MKNNISGIIKSIFDCVVFLFRKKSSKIDLSAIFPESIESIIRNERINRDFMACRSNDEYNREVVDYYKYHWDSFYLDRENGDGHFRV